MSISAVSGSNWFNSGNQSVQNKMQQVQQEFQQLGEDLQAGNLTAAQTDFATLQSLTPQNSASSSSSSDNPVAREFQQLSQDLQSGNLSGAQQDYSQLQQDFQSASAQGHHHHHHSGDKTNSQVSQLLSQLGQDLQSNNLSGAQQVYSTLEQTFQSLTSGQPSTQQSSVTGEVYTTA